jgi:uncharacterized protein with HEPN domain
MRNKRLDSKERLLHIQKSILDIERFLNDTAEDEFLNNELLHNAVLMQFIIIGEAITHVDNDILLLRNTSKILLPKVGLEFDPHGQVVRHFICTPN